MALHKIHKPKFESSVQRASQIPIKFLHSLQFTVIPPTNPSKVTQETRNSPNNAHKNYPEAPQSHLFHFYLSPYIKLRFQPQNYLLSEKMCPTQLLRKACFRCNNEAKLFIIIRLRVLAKASQHASLNFSGISQILVKIVERVLIC
jgi:hypothetical protein